MLPVIERISSLVFSSAIFICAYRAISKFFLKLSVTKSDKQAIKDAREIKNRADLAEHDWLESGKDVDRNI